MSITNLSMRAAWLFLMLLALYMLLYSGRFHSIDEVSSVALADSLLLQGKPITDQIGWSQTWSLPQGTYGVDGHLYSKKGVGYSLLLLPFQWLARQVEGAGIVGMAHLTNVFVTALTGVFLYGVVWALSGHFRVLKGSRAILSVGIVLVWGVATFAAVYSKYLFNSPAVALSMVLVVGLLFGVVNDYFTTRRFLELILTILAGMAVGFMLFTRAENALIVPLFALYLWFAPVIPLSYRVRLVRIVAFGLPVVLAVAGLFYLNWSRFGEILNFGYDLSQEANGNILVGLAGFLFSPGRSLLLMMPLLIPALIGWIRLGRHNSPLQRLAWLVVGLTIVYALFFARSADWWGGWNWGIRYFLPLLPLWCIGLIGIYDNAMNVRRYPLRGMGIWLAILLSLGVQILGILVDFNRPLLADAANNITLDAQLWSWKYSQIVSHIRYLMAWQQWDLLSVAMMDWRIAWQPVAVLILATIGLWNAHFPSPNPFYQYSLPLLAFALIQWAVVPMQQSAVQDPVWARYADDLTPLNSILNSLEGSDDSVLLFEMLLYRPYFDRAQAWLNLGTNDIPHLQWIQENNPPAPQQQLRELAIAEAKQVWVAVEGTAIGDSNSATERWLSQRAHYAGTEWVSDNTRLTTFYTTEPLSVTVENVNLSDNVSLHEVKMVSAITAGEPLRLELTWIPTATPSQDYTVFVQLLRPDGTVAAQQDSPPQAGFAPTSQWRSGMEVLDRRALLLPPDLSAGNYTLIVGMYDGNGTRLQVSTGGDFVTVGVVTVQ